MKKKVPMMLTVASSLLFLLFGAVGRVDAVPTFSFSTNGVPGFVRTGIFSSFPANTDTLFNTDSGSGSVLDSSPSVTALFGIPFPLELPSALASSAVFDLPADEVTDSTQTLSFPTTDPVVNLPAGFSVNSSSDFIVDTQFITSQLEPAPVPEPSTLLLLGSGLIGMAGMRRALKVRS